MNIDKKEEGFEKVSVKLNPTLIYSLNKLSIFILLLLF